MALPGGGYEGSAVGTLNANVFIPELWSNEIKRQRDSVFAMKGSVKMLPFMGAKGDIMHIPEVSRLAVNDKIHNTPVTLQARTETEYTIVVDRYKEVSFMIEDIVNVQSKYALRSEYTREAGYAIARDLDNAILALRADIQGYNSGSNVIYVSSDGTATGTPQAINRAGILAARQILMESNVPMSDLMLVVSPGQMTDLLTINEFVSKDFVNGTPTVNGVIGSLYGIPVTVSTNLVENTLTGYVNGAGAVGQPTPAVLGSPYLPTQTPAGITTTTLPAFGVAGETDRWVTAILCQKEWAVMGMQMSPKTESSRENLFQADAVVSTTVYGCKVYRPDHAVLIHTAI